jgi:hypothetical protein
VLALGQPQECRLLGLRVACLDLLDEPRYGVAPQDEGLLVESSAGRELSSGYRDRYLIRRPLAAGVLAGYLTGGSLAGLLSIRLRTLWLLWLAAVVQIGELYARKLGHEWRLPLLAITFGLAGAWLVANLPGRSLVMKLAGCAALAGGLANGVAIAANGRMPYLPAAARTAQIPPGLATPKNVAAAPGSHLIALGDTIPVPPLHAIISIGDILIIIATIALIASAMRTAPRHFAQHPHPHLEDAT